VYVGTLMTENAFYPVFLWAAYVLVLTLERPTARRQIVLLALCVLAFLTRAQAVALIAAVASAPPLLAWIERGRPRSLRAWSPLRWVLYHLAGLDLSLFVLPFAALIVLTANARHLDRALRAFCAAAVPLVIWLTLQVGVFASAWSLRIEERNLFYVSPLFLVALFAWLERGQPRPARAIVAAAVVAAALPATLPLPSLMNINAQSDTLFIQPWWYLADRVVGRGSIALVVVAVSLALAALFLWLSPR